MKRLNGSVAREHPLRKGNAAALKPSSNGRRDGLVCPAVLPCPETTDRRLSCIRVPIVAVMRSKFMKG